MGEPTYTTPNGSSGGRDVGLSLAGVFGDWYPDPTDGFHLFAAVGIGGATFHREGLGRRGLGASGYAVAAGGGYDFFVSRDLSLGFLPLFQYQSVEFNGVDSVEGSLETMALTLHLAMTYN